MKYIIAITLMFISFQANALMRTSLLDNTMLITDTHMYFFDKFDNYHRVKTNCSIDLPKSATVEIKGRTLKENARLKVRTENRTEVCKVLELVSSNL